MEARPKKGSVMEHLNRQQVRWFGRSSRKIVMESGEVITARLHPNGGADGVVIWKSTADVGKTNGYLHWWEDAPNLTLTELRKKFEDWCMAGRPTDI
jgi:hypothetical protein